MSDQALQILEENILRACQRVQRSRQEVKVLLATKTVAPEVILRAMQKGYSLLGENRAQELKAKAISPLLQSAEWHFIGHLQTNKIKDVLPFVSMIHSVDRLGLAEALQQNLEKQNKFLDILVQVNTSGEVSKFGLSPEDLEAFVRQTACFPNLKIKGLMTLATLSEEESEARRCFRQLRELKHQIHALQIPGVQMQELSMGMSGDYVWAIEEGATLIRVGSAIFGHRV